MFTQKEMQDSFMDMEDTIKHDIMEQKFKGELHDYCSTLTKKEKKLETFLIFFLLFWFFLMVLTQSYLKNLCFLYVFIFFVGSGRGAMAYVTLKERGVMA